jgi:arylformamidase
MTIIDLSLLVDDDTQLPIPIRKKLSFDTIKKSPGYWQSTWLSMSAHTATHIDAPLHVCENGARIGDVPLDRLVGDAVVLDLSGKGEEDATIGREDLSVFADDVSEGDVVLIRTDWGRKRWNAADLSFWLKSPVLTVDGAECLVEMKPSAVGFDCFQEYGARNVDFVPDDFAVHKVLLGAGVLIYEGLTDLHRLTRKRVKIVAAPLRLRCAEAAPARIFAIED